MAKPPLEGFVSPNTRNQFGTVFGGPLNAGRISNIGPRVLQYGLDTEAGQSGSPIFAVNAGDERVVLAVHAYGGDSANRGIRVTDDVFNLFQSWVR